MDSNKHNFLGCACRRLEALLEVKSIVTILMTVALIVMLFSPNRPNTELTALFSSVYGAVITYFFTRKND